MGIQRVQSFFPHLDLPELEAALGELLPRAGYVVRRRVQLPAGDAYPELSHVLARHPGAGAFVTFARATNDRAPAALLTSHLASHRRWDPALVRELSRALGGFGVAMEAWRGADQYGLGVFFAGRTVELRGSEAGFDEEQVFARFVDHWRVLAEGGASELYPDSGVRPHAWIVDDLRSATVLDPDEGVSLTRAALGPVEAERFGRAVAELDASVPSIGRWLPCMTFEADVPFVLVDLDEFDDRFVTSLARRLNVFATAVELRGLNLPFRWLFADGDSTTRGDGRGGDDLVVTWRDFCTCLGTSPGAVRWPAGEVGHPLADPRASSP